VEEAFVEIELFHVSLGDLDPGGIATLVKRRLHGEPFASRRSGDEFNDGFIGGERPPSPVLADEREEAVLDLVPFAGPWRKVAHVHVDVVPVGETLKLNLPESRPVAVAT
jgi:hypothetical protein